MRPPGQVPRALRTDSRSVSPRGLTTASGRRAVLLVLQSLSVFALHVPAAPELYASENVFFQCLGIQNVTRVPNFTIFETAEVVHELADFLFGSSKEYYKCIDCLKTLVSNFYPVRSILVIFEIV